MITKAPDAFKLMIYSSQANTLIAELSWYSTKFNIYKQFSKTFTGKLPSYEVVFKKEVSVCLDVVRYLKASVFSQWDLRIMYVNRSCLQFIFCSAFNITIVKEVPVKCIIPVSCVGEISVDDCWRMLSKQINSFILKQHCQ